MSKPVIRILSNLARTGGTLVSRCLGSMEHIALLSEIHPLGNGIFNPLDQARDWHAFTIPAELRGRNFDLSRAIRLIDQHCTRIGKTLVIRDWAHLDYIGRPFLETPGYEPLLNKQLSEHFEIIQCAVVRHPVDQWLSTSRLTVMQGHLDLENFLRGYRLFAERNASTGFIQFEAFTADPVTQMRELCMHLQIPFNPSFMHRWKNNTKITGDVSKTSRGSNFSTINPLERLPAEQALLDKFRDSVDSRRAVELLGYRI